MLQKNFFIIDIILSTPASPHPLSKEKIFDSDFNFKFYYFLIKSTVQMENHSPKDEFEIRIKTRE